MLAEVVLVEQGLRHGLGIRIGDQRLASPLRPPLRESPRYMPPSTRSCPRRMAHVATRTAGTAKGSRSSNRRTITWSGVDLVVALDFGLCQRRRYRNRPVEIVRVGCAEARNLSAGLSPRCGVARMCMDYAAHCRKCLVEDQVRGKSEDGRKVPSTVCHPCRRSPCLTASSCHRTRRWA